MLNCPYCGSNVGDETIDGERDLATCPSCRHLIDLRTLGAIGAIAGVKPPPAIQSAMGIPATGMPPPGTAVSGSYPSGASESSPGAGEPGPRPRMRPAVPLPQGMTIEQEESSFIVGSAPAAITITRRWFNSRHLVSFLVLMGAGVGLAMWAVDGQPGVGWGLLALLWLFFDYTLLKMLINRTRIRVADSVVEVRHGPLPSLTIKDSRFSTEELEQLYAQRVRGRYAVMAKTRANGLVQVVAPVLQKPEQALFVEQQLERALGIVDYEVPGELDSQLRQASNPRSGKAPAAAAGAAVLAPLVLGGGITALVLFLIQVELTGQLQVTGSPSWTFVPDDCESGQHHGFFGVTLMSSSQPDAFVRIMVDPMKGGAVMLSRAGQRTVLTTGDCASFDAQVHRTNTTINDIRALDATLRLQCENVTANVTAENCH